MNSQAKTTKIPIHPNHWNNTKADCATPMWLKTDHLLNVFMLGPAAFFMSFGGSQDKDLWQEDIQRVQSS